MNEAPAPKSQMQRESRVLPFAKVALVLQGGGALGAYQAGVYVALAEAGIELDLIRGISIGSVNAALIVGNPPEKRVARLRQFWEAVTEPPAAFPALACFADPASWSGLPWANGERARAWANKTSAAARMFYGAANFFSRRPVPPLYAAAERPDAVSYYDTAPLKATLERLVDFDLVNNSPIELSVSATHVRSGEPVHFDNRTGRIGVAHIMASGALPPGFPPVEIDGEYYWDGGVVSNSAVQAVLDSKPRGTGLCFQVDLWDRHGEVPLDMTAAILRAMEIHSASRISYSLDGYRRMQHARRALGRLLDRLPEASREDPDIQMLVEEADPRLGTLVQLKYQAKNYEGSSKLFDFSRRSMIEHWQAGCDGMRRALREPRLLELPDPSEAVRVFDVHHGWER